MITSGLDPGSLPLGCGRKRGREGRLQIRASASANGPNRSQIPLHSQWQRRRRPPGRMTLRRS